MSRLAIVIVVVAVLAAGGAIAMDDATEDTTSLTTVENESFTPENGSNDLENSNLEGAYYGNESTVTVYNNSSVVEPSGNYSWQQSNGTVDVENQSYLDNRSSANISYEYREPSERKLALVRIMSVALGPLAEGLIIVMGLALVLVSLRAFGG